MEPVVEEPEQCDPHDATLNRQRHKIEKMFGTLHTGDAFTPAMTDAPHLMSGPGRAIRRSAAIAHGRRTAGRIGSCQQVAALT